MPTNPFKRIERAFDLMRHRLGSLDDDLFTVDVADAGDEFFLTADLPASKRETVDVELAGQSLTISAIREPGDADETEAAR